MIRITTGDRRTLTGPWTEICTCSLGPGGEVVAVRPDWIVYHRGGPGGLEVVVVGLDTEGRDLIAEGTRSLADIEEAVTRSGRVEQAPIAVAPSIERG